ncbi:uncharacterized protein LOC111404368 [Olea europaea var. sylvestris]|uniref:uncharacterized protein LOC111404368 n=1 Tax=Olea europaea var. sylvestris TaxID=158386 RepID=UPI000C1D8704|nr:uncharacterized protein LOC111404368 [Olea europaea var. sylvestris]
MQQNTRTATGFTPNTPFTPEVLSYPLPDRFKYPRIKEYDRTTDPINHLNVYTDIMNLQVALDAVMCKAYSQTLTNAARDWFSTLEPNSITSFSDLADMFSAFFASSKRIRKTAASLMQMRQGPNETLRSFMTRFNKERLQIPDLHITAAISALTYAIKCEAFKMSLSKTLPKSVTELLTQAEKYINMKETMAPKREVTSSGRLDQKRPHESNLRQETPRVKPRKDPPSTAFTHLNTSRDHGHTTEDCLALKREIEALIRRGFLSSYINNDKRLRNNQNGGKGPEDRGNKQPTASTINIIVRGTASGGDSSSGRKQYARQPPIISRPDLGRTEDISFGMDDLEGIAFPHGDALVISAIIANFEVKRILVDNGSATNVLSHEDFVQMGISSEQLKPVKTPLQGFGGGVIAPEGIVGLPLTLGTEGKQVTQITTFEVVRTSMVYNAILGRPMLNRIRAIVSTFHLAMKFPTPNGIGIVRSNQTVARQCYVTSVRKIKNDVMQVTELELEHESYGRLAPVEGLEEVKIEPGRKVTVGRGLDAEIMAELLSCLSRNIDVFAWNVEDMPGIDPDVAVHRFNVNPEARSVKQRKRQFAPERREVIKEEITKLLNAQFVREVQYPEWLANVVLVKKANGKWRVCINFTDLNKACPKDSYPLPRIDNLVDSTSGHMLYNFLDAFSGYHQILMVEEDQEKTSFMADSAIYCYRVMPFGLKNAGTTYQRYSMKLNPAKCAFGVASGKFLGFMITHRGIEANPDKIQALINMEAPKCKRDIQKLTGRIAALNRFVSRAADRCSPFFKLLRGNKGFDWSEECNLAFQEPKQTLSTPLVLTKPEPDDTLLLYLAVSQNAVSGVLVKERGRVQQPIYYVSKVLLDAETRYTLAEQLALALVVAIRKLRPYFQSHPIVVLTNQPLRHILQKPDVSGRLLKWLTSRSSETLAGSPNSTSGVWEIFVDGASNSSGSGAGIIITSSDKITEIQCALKFEFQATNNEAEYEAVVIALELAKNLECEHVKIFSDSQLVVEQIEGSFERKEEKMSLYCLKVHDLQRQFVRCEILKVARAENAKADALSRLVFMGVDGFDRTVHIKMVAEASIAQKPSIMDIDHEPSWMDPIVDYISNGNTPADPRLARSIRYRAAKYCIIEGVLFRKSLTLPYLRCLRPSESLQAMTEVHEGICGNHQGARALAHKLIRYGYYWPTPFEQWGVDILGPFSLARGQLKFVAVAVEYFTKWVEAEPLATISEPKLRSFIWKFVICRFGIPKDLRTRIGDAKGDWPDMLPSILWAYRTSHKTATGKTPFMLAFGLEATIPIEVSLPTIRKLETNTETHTTEHLDLLEEVREQASLRTASYQNRTAKHFNKKVKNRRFRAGDLVLRKAEAAGHQPGKLGPTWEGPYEVIRKLKGGAYSLRDTSGNPLPRPWNANNLKIYYK